MKINKKNILFLCLWLVTFLSFLSLLIVSSIYFTHYDFDKNSINYWYKFICLISLLTSSIILFVSLLLILKFFYEVIYRIKLNKNSSLVNNNQQIEEK